MTFRIPEILGLRSGLFTKGYGGKWITVAGIAAFQREKGARAFFKISCFVLALGYLKFKGMGLS